MKTWELLIDGDGGPAYNMARDAWLLERLADSGVPIVRLYGWQGFALSLGRAQQAAGELDLAACAAEGIPLVRRTTGGRAVLHGSDLTYALCAPTTKPPFQGGLLPIYREVSRVFVTFLRELGLEPEVKTYSGRQRAELASPICFFTPSAFEILVDGKKLVGSAQRLLPRALLQHGSIPLAPQQERLARLFHGATRQQVAAQMTDLETLGIVPGLSGKRLRGLLAEAFAGAFGIEFSPLTPGAAGEARIRELMADYPLLTPDEIRPSRGQATLRKAVSP